LQLPDWTMRLLTRGVRPDMAPDLVRRLMAANYIATVGPPINLALGAGAYVLGAPVKGMILAIASAGYALVLPLIGAGHHRFARHLLAISVLFGSAGMGLVDPESTIWATVLVTAVVAAMFFTADEISYATLHLALHGIALVAVLFMPTMDLPGELPLPHWLANAIILVCGVVPPAMIVFLNVEVRKAETEQALAVDALQHEVERRVSLAQALAEQTRRAEAASLAKSSFLANMSHEIRTPLGAIISLTELGRESTDHDERSEYLRVTDQAARHLLRILNDILDLSKIEAGKLGFERIATDLGQEARDTVELVRARAAEKDLQLHLDVDFGERPVRLVDPLRLRQVLLNLLNNAIKFTDDGSVTLWGRAEGEQVLFEVRDTGIGMSGEEMARIFQPFEQASSGTTRRFGGTGLGLTISRHILQAWGGTMTPSSVEGIGSTFRVELVLPEVEEEEDPTTSAHDPSLVERSLRLLVAEDNPVNQMIIKRILERSGHEVVLVDDGEPAVEHAQDGFDAILMDMRMPRVDGVQATARIREAERADRSRRVPIIALTASALAEERQRCLDAGMDAYLTKPVDRARLARLLDQLVEDGAHRHAS